MRIASCAAGNLESTTTSKNVNITKDISIPITVNRGRSLLRPAILVPKTIGISGRIHGSNIVMSPAANKTNIKLNINYSVKIIPLISSSEAPGIDSIALPSSSMRIKVSCIATPN